MMISYVDERFLSEYLGETPSPVPFETFKTILERGKEPSDPWLARFLETQLFMQELARLERAPAPEESYNRYKEWLPFVYRSRAFFEASAKGLGYELHELDRSPGERLF